MQLFALRASIVPDGWIVHHKFHTDIQVVSFLHEHALDANTELCVDGVRGWSVLYVVSPSKMAPVRGNPVAHVQNLRFTQIAPGRLDGLGPSAFQD